MERVSPGAEVGMSRDGLKPLIVAGSFLGGEFSRFTRILSDFSQLYVAGR
jgi:hypothetical protein